MLVSCCQLPGSLADRRVSSSAVRDFSLPLYPDVSRSHLSQIAYELWIVMRSLGMTKIPSLVVSTSSIFVSVSNPAVTSLLWHNRLSSAALDPAYTSEPSMSMRSSGFLLVYVSKPIN